MPAWRAASPRELPSSTRARARASIRREAAASRQRFASRRRSPALSSRRVTATVIVPSQDRTLPAERTGCDRVRLRPCGRVRNRGRWYERNLFDLRSGGGQMRTSRFTDEHIIGIVKEYEAGAKLTELCRRHGTASRRRPSTSGG